MTKKMSSGTVAGKNKQVNDLASSFFLYKINGQEKNKEHMTQRQVRTSGGSRGKNTNIDE